VWNGFMEAAVCFYMMKERGWWLGRVAMAATALWAGVVGAQAQQMETPVFHAETHLVELTFSVRSADGTPVRGLEQDDFQVAEDGVQQTIAFFGKETDLPLTLGLLVDASDSQSKFYKRHRRDIEKFLAAVVRPQDEVFSICFGDHLRLTNDNTADTAKVLDGLKRFDDGDRHFPELAEEDKRDGGTAVYDAVYYSIREKLAKAKGRRRALVLFTDGEENSSSHDLLDAIDAARESDTLIYAIRYTDEKDGRTAHAQHGTAALHHMAAETGGADYDALHTDVKDAFAQIAEELRSLYSIAYHSTHKSRNGGFHRVLITTEKSDYTVRARTGYYAR
jgi:Ca-activated chloride channel homolog